MPAFCDNDRCTPVAHYCAPIEDTGLDLADETALEDGYYRPRRRVAAVIPLTARMGEAA